MERNVLREHAAELQRKRGTKGDGLERKPRSVATTADRIHARRALQATPPRGISTQSLWRLARLELLPDAERDALATGRTVFGDGGFREAVYSSDRNRASSLEDQYQSLYDAGWGGAVNINW